MGKGQHPVRYHWSVARRFLRGLKSTETDLSNPSLAIVTKIAGAIESTRILPGYGLAFGKNRIKTSAEVEPALYEMFTAQFYSKRSSVEFVPTTNAQTPLVT